jgi:hypothetical protein
MVFFFFLSIPNMYLMKSIKEKKKKKKKQEGPLNYDDQNINRKLVRNSDIIDVILIILQYK